MDVPRDSHDAQRQVRRLRIPERVASRKVRAKIPPEGILAAEKSPRKGFRNDGHAAGFIRIAGFESAPFLERHAHRPEKFRIDNPEPRGHGLARRRRRTPFDFEINGRTEDAERRIVRHGRSGNARQSAHLLQHLIHEMPLRRAGCVTRRRHPELRGEHVVRIHPSVHPQQAQRASGGHCRADEQHSCQSHFAHDEQIARVPPAGRPSARSARQQRARVEFRRPDGWTHSEQRTGSERNPHREAEHGEIDAEAVHAPQLHGADSPIQKRHGPRRQ